MPLISITVGIDSKLALGVTEKFARSQAGFPFFHDAAKGAQPEALPAFALALL